MELIYIKANGEDYYPCEPKTQMVGYREGYYCPVLKIKKLMFGRWQIDYHTDHYNGYCKGGYPQGYNQTPNTRMILYPRAIEEIKYKTGN